ncbi:uncharacterized protein BJX67DRAFT_298773 [Aspergillus lucknowensis]|uniref:Uncharacterized protein n=1 Tax=Aspergillus lucknowensis TaxID=176173 RepID=A0ABR4LCV0_9EURO
MGTAVMRTESVGPRMLHRPNLSSHVGVLQDSPRRYPWHKVNGLYKIWVDAGPSLLQCSRALAALSIDGPSLIPSGAQGLPVKLNIRRRLKDVVDDNLDVAFHISLPLVPSRKTNHIFSVIVPDARGCRGSVRPVVYVRIVPPLLIAVNIEVCTEIPQSLFVVENQLHAERSVMACWGVQWESRTIELDPCTFEPVLRRTLGLFGVIESCEVPPQELCLKTTFVVVSANRVQRSIGWTSHGASNSPE